MAREYFSTASERRLVLYLVDAIGLTDAEVAKISGRSLRQIGTWRKRAGIPGKRGKSPTIPPNARQWLAGLLQASTAHGPRSA